MQTIFGFLASVIGIYSLLLVARILLTWFSGFRNSGITQFLSRITDPYLNWWRSHFKLRVGFLDLSPLAGIVALQVLQTIFSSIAATGSISVGILLAILINALWSVVSFLLGFCVIVLAIRLVGYFMKKEMYGNFWQIVDSISRPLMFRITRIFFQDRIVSFITGMAISLGLLAALWMLGGIAVRMLIGMLVRTL